MPARPRRLAHLILGEDSYLRQQARDELLALVPEEARAFAVQEFSLARADLDEVQRAATTPTLLSPRQVLLLRDAGRLGEEDVEQLGELIDSLPDFTLLIFEEEKLDKRTRVYQLLSKKCELHPADPGGDAVAVGQVEKMARELGLRLSRARAGELVAAVGPNLGFLKTELEKLRTFAGEGREVTAGDLTQVVVPARRFIAFDLIGLIAERRRAEALQLLKRLLAQGENPIPIVGMLTWLYRQLLIAQGLPAGTPPGKARSLIGGPQERKDQLLRVGRKFSREQLRQAFAALADADVSLKSSAPDPPAVVELLVVRLTRGAAAPVGR
ncbi:MAG: DNA polymerase III subunit delta [Candidatus Acidiferrales bacterium]